MQLSEELTRAFISMGRFVHAIESDLSRPDFLVLARLGSGDGVRSRELARAVGLDPSTMSRRVASLVGRGLVERLPDPSDGRAQVLRLTGHGRQTVADERARRVELVTEALAGWEEQDRAELARLLARLTDTIDARQGT